MMQTISNISSIITAVTFIVYLIGRFIRIGFSKYNTHERFTVFKREKSERNIDEETNFLEITSIGDEFIVEAENDVRKITFFRCDFEDDFSKIKTKDKIGEWGHLGAHDRLYVRCDLGEFLPFIRVEIERLDFTRVSFNLNTSGKNYIWRQALLMVPALADQGTYIIASERTCLAQHHLSYEPLVLHSDNGTPMKGATMLETLYKLGITPSNSRPRVSNDNPYSESLFKTLKYRPNYHPKGFESLEDASAWCKLLFTGTALNITTAESSF